MNIHTPPIIVLVKALLALIYRHYDIYNIFYLYCTVMILNFVQTYTITTIPNVDSSKGIITLDRVCTCVDNRGKLEHDMSGLNRIKG